MTAPRVTTIRDRLPSTRTLWADLADSSQECSRDIPPAPLVDDSYDTPAAGVEAQRTRLTAAALERGPLNFGFLLNDSGSTGANGSQAAGSTLAAPAAATSSGVAPSASQSRALNPAAPVFVPSASAVTPSPQSPEMPPPAVPQAAAKSKRVRGKRALSSVQESAMKRTREQDRAAAEAAPAAQPQQRSLPLLEPPPATEEEWQHRIAKRIKVVTSIKETREYQEYVKIRTPTARVEGEPQTPTAEDRALSKRRWEYEIQQWRSNLKKWIADNVPGFDDMQTDEAGVVASRGSSEEAEDPCPAA